MTEQREPHSRGLAPILRRWRSTMGKQSDLLQKAIDGIKLQFGFNDYPLLEVLNTFEHNYETFTTNTKTLHNTKPAFIKKEFEEFFKYLSKANALLNNKKQELFPFFTIERDFAFKFINNYLPEFLLITGKEISLIKDLGGRPKTSLQEFLIFYLLIIYKQGTKQPIKCYWSETDEVAKGKTFEFISAVREISPQISNKFIVSPKNKVICKTVKKLKSRFHDFSKLPPFNSTET